MKMKDKYRTFFIAEITYPISEDANHTEILSPGQEVTFSDNFFVTIKSYDRIELVEAGDVIKNTGNDIEIVRKNPVVNT